MNNSVVSNKSMTGALYKQRFGYGLGDFACNLIWQVISLYLLYFYTDIMKLDATAIAAMFVVCRVIDGVTDLLVGFAIDKTRTRWGKSSIGANLRKKCLKDGLDVALEKLIKATINSENI